MLTLSMVMYQCLYPRFNKNVYCTSQCIESDWREPAMQYQQIPVSSIVDIMLRRLPLVDYGARRISRNCSKANLIARASSVPSTQASSWPPLIGNTRRRRSLVVSSCFDT